MKNDIVFPYPVPLLLVAYALTLYVVYRSKPIIELENTPIPIPSIVLLSFIVGNEPLAIFQQTPRAVTDAPPSLVIFPPLVAVVLVIPVIVIVVIAGGPEVIKLISFP